MISGSTRPVGRISCSTDVPAAVLELEVTRRRGHEDGPAHVLLELLELERTVVECAGQPEPVLDQRFLARAIAAVHRADLRHRLVRLVDDEQEVLGKVVDQRRRRLARARARTGGASSSRCPARSPSVRASRGRTWCAARAAASRGSDPPCRSSRAVRGARSRIASMARASCCRGRDVVRPGVDRVAVELTRARGRAAGRLR